MTFSKWIAARAAIAPTMISNAAALPSASATEEAPPNAAARAVDFEACYEAHFDFVARALRHLGVADAARDDAAQEVFLVVHRRLATFDHAASMRSWLFAIAVNVARDQRRSLRRKGGHAPLPDDLADGSPGPHDALARSEALRLGERLLATLDEDRRVVFLMVDYEQMSVPEVAAALGVNVNTLYSRLRAARIDFDAALSRHRARTR